MTHKSRLGEITIDCSGARLTQAVLFWEQALGLKARKFEDHFRFDVSGDEVAINLQSVTHPPRVHLDIETDNIAAEVRRLENIGASKLRTERRWTVMRTPTGHGICICNPSRRSFETEANIWA